VNLLNPQTGKLEDVGDQAHDLFTSGKYQLPEGTPVTVRDRYGYFQTVAPQEVSALIRGGGRLATDKEVLQKEYGGLGGQAIAGAEGLARGVSLGTSDLLAEGIGQLAGGDEGAEAVRKHLEGYKSAHPITSTGTEILGAILPAVATGGESAAETTAELAARGGAGALERGAGALAERGAGALAERGAGALAERGATGVAERELLGSARPSLVSAIAGYTPAGLTARAGRAIEGAASEVLGAPGTRSALGRIAALAASKAPALATEGAIYGAAGGLDESILGDEKLTGEKLASAIGHGVMWNMILGGAGEAAMGAAGAGAMKARPLLERAASEKAFDMLGAAAKRGAKEVEAVGGAKSIGETIQKHLDLGSGGLSDTVRDSLITPETLVPKLDKAVLKQQAAVEDFAIKNPGAEGHPVAKSATPEFEILSKELSQLQLAKSLAEKSAASPGHMDVGGLMSTGTAAVHAMSHPATGLPHLAAAYGHKLLSSHQDAIAATMLAKISKLDVLARAVNQVDHTLRTGIEAAIMDKGKWDKKTESKFSGPAPGATHEDKWEYSRNYGKASVVATQEHLDQILPQLSTHAPKTAQSAVQSLNQGAQFALMRRPNALNRPTLTDVQAKPRVSPTDAEEHYERVRAIEDPATTLSDGLRSGDLSRVQVEAIQASSPALLDNFKSMVLEALTKDHPPLHDDQVRCLEYLFAGQGDELSDPIVSTVLQSTYAPAQQQAGTPSPSRLKPVSGLATSGQTKLQKIAARG
jgi:hypothetical protein